MGRSALQASRSLAMFHRSSAVSPVSASSCCTQVYRGRRLGRLHCVPLPSSSSVRPDRSLHQQLVSKRRELELLREAGGHVRRRGRDKTVLSCPRQRCEQAITDLQLLAVAAVQLLLSVPNRPLASGLFCTDLSMHVCP